MIAWLSGKLILKKPSHTIVETGGVGYLVHITLPSFYVLPEQGAQARLHIHTNVKEDAIQLFGFVERKEMEMFNLLIKVNKVGPKLAMTILSGIPCNELARAVQARDIAKLTSVPGIGAKTAERIALELSGKLADMLTDQGDEAGAATPSSPFEDDAVRALVSLGYKKNEALKAIKSAVTGGADELESAIKSALAILSG